MEDNFPPSLSLLSYQNAPDNFHVMLVAIRSSGDDSDYNEEMTRHFAREKQLDLVVCNIDDKVKVQQVFEIIVEKIMTSSKSENVAG